jgi:hypothetical protein
MMDKEISAMVAPRVASWAASEVVQSAPAFWRRNHLISNDGGEHALEYSIRCALRGDGVLLHPEGSVHYTAARVHPLFRGIVEMALEASRRAGDERPVYIVPLVYKYLYVRDVSAGLHAEMRVIEQALGVEGYGGRDPASRLFALLTGVLERQMRRFGHTASGGDFFDRQIGFRDALVSELSARYAIERTGSLERDLLRFKKAINASPACSVEDLMKANEALRLTGFTRADYGTLLLTQEQIHECLKRLRGTLMTRGWRQTVHNFLPKPSGPRVAHVRVPEAIRVDSGRAGGSDVVRQSYGDELLETVRARMQEALDAIETPQGVPTWSNPFGPRIPNPSRGATVSPMSRCQPPGMKADLAEAAQPVSRTG